MTGTEGGQNTELQLKPKPYGGDVVVRVVDQRGKPIKGAELFNRGNSSRDVRRATTNTQGEALMQDVQKSYAGFVVVAKAAGFVTQEAQAVPGTIEEPGELQFRRLSLPGRELPLKLNPSKRQFPL